MKKTKADLVPSWRENFFVFENTPLHQVARSLEDYYGLEVTIADQQLATKTFTAKISRDDLPMLLKAIEASFGVSVTREEQAIHIQP
jgi:transmembrane sensor